MLPFCFGDCVFMPRVVERLCHLIACYYYISEARSLPSWTDRGGRGAQLAAKGGRSGHARSGSAIAGGGSSSSAGTSLGAQSSAIVAVQTFGGHITGRPARWLARLTTARTTVGART